MAVAANSNFKLASVNIRASFLQSRTLDRDVFMKPPPDIRKEGVIWKLKKPLYGLDKASCKGEKVQRLQFEVNPVNARI